MPTVFIVRPFGKKRVAISEGQSVEVDFEAIDEALIKPALAGNGLEGETTEVIAAAGNIRVDMFERLITYDLVIADEALKSRPGDERLLILDMLVLTLADRGDPESLRQTFPIQPAP